LESVNLPLPGSPRVGPIPGIIIGSRLTASIPDLLRPILAGTQALVGKVLFT
jgi:hypothetical protein